MTPTKAPRHDQRTMAERGDEQDSQGKDATNAGETAAAEDVGTAPTADVAAGNDSGAGDDSGADDSGAGDDVGTAATDEVTAVKAAAKAGDADDGDDSDDDDDDDDLAPATDAALADTGENPALAPTADHVKVERPKSDGPSDAMHNLLAALVEQARALASRISGDPERQNPCHFCGGPLALWENLLVLQLAGVPAHVACPATVLDERLAAVGPDAAFPYAALSASVDARIAEERPPDATAGVIDHAA